MERYQKQDPDDAIIEKMFSYIRVGAEFVVAARACGVNEQTIKDWKLKMAQAPTEHQGQYYKLHEAVIQAEAIAQIIALQRLSAEGGAAGAKWLIEKMAQKTSPKDADDNWPF